VFYLKYDMYRNAWPLLALATYRKIAGKAKATHMDEVDGHPHPGMETARDAVDSQS
jgi:hypothetical protein